MKRQDIGLYIVKRKCYHCGYEMELAVLEGLELCEPSPEEPCDHRGYHISFHENYGMFINIKGQPKKYFSWEPYDGIAD